MRKEIVWPIFLALVLFAVIYTQRQLKTVIEDPSKMGELPFAADEPDPAAPLPPSEAGESAPDTSMADAQNAAVTPPPAPMVEPNPEERKLQQTFETARIAFQKKNELKQATDQELHHTPELMIKAAQELGAVVELEAEITGYPEAFSNFYLACSRDEATFTAIRAQCLEKYMLRQNMTEQERTAFLAQFPEPVVKIYQAF